MIFPRAGRLKKFVVLGFMCAVLLASTVVDARERRIVRPDYDYSTGEIVAFAFHHLVGTMPDFNSWVHQTPSYKELRPADKAAYVLDEVERLRQGFYGFYPQEDQISIKVPVRVKIRVERDRSGIMELVFPGAPGNYFPFPMGEMWIAVAFGYDAEPLAFPLTAGEVDKFANYMQSHPNDSYIANIELQPLAADGREPFDLGEVFGWLMITEVVSVVIHNEEGTVELWGYEKGGDPLEALKETPLTP